MSNSRTKCFHTHSHTIKTVFKFYLLKSQQQQQQKKTKLRNKNNILTENQVEFYLQYMCANLC